MKKEILDKIVDRIFNRMFNYEGQVEIPLFEATIEDLREIKQLLQEKPKLDIQGIEKIVYRVESWVVGILEWSGDYTKKDHESIMQEIEKDLKND